MNINTILSVDNDITKAGLSSIIRDGIIGCNISFINKSEIIKKIAMHSSDIAMIEIKNETDLDLIKKIIEIDSKVKIILLSDKVIQTIPIKFFKENNIDFILTSSSYDSIVKQLIFITQQRKKKRDPLRIRKKHKSQNIHNLLSNRELEISFMLVRGESLTSISEKKDLALTTISTYKKRIFEKTKVKNLIELSELVKKHQKRIHSI